MTLATDVTTSPGAAPAEHSGVPPADPSAHVIFCPFDGALMFGVSEGKWSAGADAYAEVIYRHDGCPAVDPTARSARPALLAHTTDTRPRRPRRGFGFARRSS